MGGPRRTARVQIEDLFAGLSADLREAVLESLRTIHRIQSREEAKAKDRPPLQQHVVHVSGDQTTELKG